LKNIRKEVFEINNNIFSNLFEILLFTHLNRFVRGNRYMLARLQDGDWRIFLKINKQKPKINI